MCLKKDVTVPVVPTALTKLIAVTAITLYNNTNTKKYLKKDIIVPQSRDAYLWLNSVLLLRTCIILDNNKRDVYKFIKYQWYLPHCLHSVIP